MGGELVVTRSVVAAPDHWGDYRKWSMLLEALNFNVPVPTVTIGDIRLRLLAYGNWACIRSIQVSYVGSAAGVLIQPEYYQVGWAESQLTQFATDRLEWPTVNWLIDLRDGRGAYSLAVTVTGYAATDDIYMMIEGEVW